MGYRLSSRIRDSLEFVRYARTEALSLLTLILLVGAALSIGAYLCHYRPTSDLAMALKIGAVGFVAMSLAGVLTYYGGIWLYEHFRNSFRSGNRGKSTFIDFMMHFAL